MNLLHKKIHHLREILGQKPAITLLYNALKKGKLAHAYLFCGPKGVGKKSTAIAFLYHLFCQINSDEPCGSCLACKKIDRENHPDIYKVSPEIKDIKIDTVRSVERFLRTGPIEGPYKVILFEEAEKLNPEAGNALLKSLEEPPPYALFILLTEHPNQILPTIISRSQIVRFGPLPQGLIKEYLINSLRFEEDYAQSLAELSQGSLKRALDIAESGVLEELNAFIKASLEKNLSHRLKVIEKLAKQDKDRLELFLYLLALWIWSSYLKRKTENFYPQALPEMTYQGDPLKLFSIITQANQALESLLHKELTLLMLSQNLVELNKSSL